MPTMTTFQFGKHKKSTNHGKPVKITVLGQSAVGKTALCVRFMTRRFIGEYDPTLETTHQFRTFVDGDPGPVDFEILDTAGQAENYLTQSQIKWADAFIIVYSVTDRCSFDEVMRLKFIINKTKDREVAVLIVGNKIDLTFDRMVSKEEGEKLAKSLNCSFLEISVRESYDDVKYAFLKVYHDMKHLTKRTSSPKLFVRSKSSAQIRGLTPEVPRPRERSMSVVHQVPLPQMDQFMSSLNE
ncbi:ras-related and estrogen-regulated growth inhibitor-like [Saccoglossus kowalevskii]|uniref:small monomeric GTPase n=1 Tax=Saccoglossus kowalevskii TaxID=10224 RepID=A0ABM0MPZ4_SACKO|nr:PREDICTED: ras-related and estrogen-regulated growth inhibitor-like [Saccoglossus kowalevskii]